jgi:very-short-patch-repair endonuclease
MAKRIIPEPFLTNSKNLRKNQTPWEAKLWARLRAGRFYGLKFKRQVQIGLYIFDFGCREKLLLIELDGGQHSEKKNSAHDFTKQDYAFKEDYRVLRFWNNDVDNNIEGVLEIIKKECGV